MPRVSITLTCSQLTERGLQISPLVLTDVSGRSHLNSIDFWDVQGGYEMMDHDVFLSTYVREGEKKRESDECVLISGGLSIAVLLIQYNISI